MFDSESNYALKKLTPAPAPAPAPALVQFLTSDSC